MKANKTNSFIFVHATTDSRKEQFIATHARKKDSTSYGIIKETHDLSTVNDLLKLKSYNWDAKAKAVIFISGIAKEDAYYVIEKEIMVTCPKAKFTVIS